MPLGKYIEDIGSDDSSLQVYCTDHSPHNIIDVSNIMSGVVRINRGRMEYYATEISDWLPLNGVSVRIDMIKDPEHDQMLEWYRKKIIEEFELEQKLKKYPALKKAKENYDLVYQMTNEG